MGKARAILLAVCILVVLAAISTISYANGWRVTLLEPGLSAPNLQEPAWSYG